MNKKLIQETIRQSLARQSLLGFILYTFKGYKAGWVHEEICQKLDDFLDAVRRKESPRLMLTMPPRSGKTEIVSRRFPAYVFGRYPDTSIIATSYAADLASRNNRDVQKIMDDIPYGEIFPQSKLYGKNTRSNVQGTYLRNSDIFEVVGHKGVYKSAGIGGGITGMGGDILIVDDVFKDRSEADSPTIRNKVYNWYTSTLYTRLSPGGGILIIMTRWHPIKDDTPVLTTKGWKKHGELKIGDYVFGIDGKPVKVKYVTPPVWCDVKISTETEDIICSKTHLWAVKSRPEHKPKVVEAGELLKINKQRTLPKIKPIEFTNTVPLPIDPYWLGLWLGDGDKKAPIIRCGKNYYKHCESTVYSYKKRQCSHGDYFYTYTGQGIRKHLTKLNLINNKHIPDIYKTASVSDRLELLAGLIDSDGDKSNNLYRFANTNMRLYRDVKDVVHSLGMICSNDVIVNKKNTVAFDKYKRNYDCLRFSFSPTIEIPCKIKYKKINKLYKKERGITASLAPKNECGWGRCISTTAKDGLYLVGKSLIPTHNTDDLCGRLLEKDKDAKKWEVIEYPAIATHDEPHRKQGEALHPERYDLKELLQIKSDIGSRDWEALYQQKPTVNGGTVFKKEWFKYWNVLPSRFDTMITSWDMTFKGTDGTDYVVGQVWGRKGADCYLIDQVRKRMSFTETLHEFIKLSNKYPKALKKLVEDKANGSAVIDTLKNTVQGITPIEPDGGKVSRAYAITPMLEAGNVYIPSPLIYKWVDDYVTELTNFPVVAHDDQVDATTQALRELQQRRSIKINSGILFR